MTKQLLNAGRGHQAPRNAGRSLQKEVGQNIKDKKRDKRVRDGDPSWGGNREGEVSKQQEAFSQVGLWGVLESQRATEPGGKNSTEYVPNHDSQQRSSPDSRPEAGKGGAGCMLKVRTRPECSEDNLRELM